MSDPSRMTFDATHTLRFVNTARAAMGLAPLDLLPFLAAERVSERSCVLALALQAEVGGSADPVWDDYFVVRFPHMELAEAVGHATGQPFNGLGEVLLPEELANLAVGFDSGWITAANTHYLSRGQMCFEDLELRLICVPHRDRDARSRLEPVAA